MEQIFRSDDGQEFETEEECAHWEIDTRRIGDYLRSKGDGISAKARTSATNTLRDFFKFEREKEAQPVAVRSV